MVKVSLQITEYTPDDKKVNDKIPYINPQADNATLVEFARLLMSLSDNTYVGTTKITEEAID